METIELPIWLVFAYPLIALLAYFLLIYFIRKNGPKRLFQSISSGKGDNVFIAFWQRYGGEIMKDAIKIGGPMIVNDLMSHMDAYMKGNVGQIKKQFFKKVEGIAENVEGEVQAYMAEKYPVVAGLADQFGVGMPSNPFVAKMMERFVPMDKIEGMAEDKMLSAEEKEMLNKFRSLSDNDGSQVP